MRPKLRLTRLGAGLLALASLSACTTAGKDLVSPANLPMPAGYAMAGERAPPRVVLEAGARSREWWKAFGSPQLDEAIRLALEESPDLAAARATLDRHRAEAEAAEALLKPQIGLNARAERQLFNSRAFGFNGFPSRTFNIFSLGGVVSYDPDLFGVGRGRAAEARAMAEAAHWEADAAALALSANLAVEAVRIAGLNAQIESAEKVLDDDRKLVDLAHKAEALGGLSRSGRIEIDAQLAADEALMPDLFRQKDQARRRLAVLVGKHAADWSPPDFHLEDLKLPAALPVALPSDLVKSRPDIQAAEAELRAARIAARVQQVDSLPKIRITGDYAQTSNDLEKLFSSDSKGWNLVGGLTVPIYDGGLSRAHRQAAQADLREAEARYRKTVLAAFSQVGGLMSSLEAGETEIAAYRRAVDSAQQDADITLAGVRLGGTPLLRAIDARRQLSRARRNLATAEARRLSDMVGLFAAAGADWRAPAND